MKIPPLLVQYLHTYKRLDLPGIGTFMINETAYPEPENHKHDKQAGLETVSFESNTNIKQNAELVQFITEQSGRIKALAAADLESHLALAKQFLNIGNPFLFDGIGNLVKIRSGEYALSPIPGMLEKTSRDKSDSNDPGEFQNDYKKIFYAGKIKMKWRKPFVIILFIAGLALAVWGGYTVYKMTKKKNKTSPGIENKKEETVPFKDSVMYQKDSVILPVQTNPVQTTPVQTTSVQTTPAGMQKFVLEISKARRAFERFGRLRTFLWNVQMETKDSVNYKLFMMLPATVSDTTRIIDSLTRLNGRRVYIEQ